MNAARLRNGSLGLVTATAVVLLHSLANAQFETDQLLWNSVPDGSTARTDNYAYAGFGFWVPTNGTTINALGYWDEGEDGLQVAHTVALMKYSTDQSGFPGANGYDLIAQETVPAGTGAPLIGGFRWVLLPEAITLDNNGQNGAYYSLLASNGTDTWYDLNGINLNSNLALGNAGGSTTDSGSNPLNDPQAVVHVGGTAYGAGNVAFIVPEPGSLVLGGCALVGLVMWRRRLRWA